jgi:hypothetical protein
MLNLVWSQWTTMGVMGNAGISRRWILDPEALVLFTCEIGRYEARIFDSMIEWLVINQRFLNVQRLKTINKRENFTGKALLASIASVLMKPSSEAKWKRLSREIRKNGLIGEPLFYFKNGKPHPQVGEKDEFFSKTGFTRNLVKLRNISEAFNPGIPANLILKLRALFGVSSRCEVIAYLLTHEEANPTAIASSAGYNSKTIYNTLNELHGSGGFNRRISGRETLYSLESDSWKRFLGYTEDIPEWINWPVVFRVLEMLWKTLDDPRLAIEAQGVAASQLNLVLTDVLPRLQEAVPEYSRNSHLFHSKGNLDSEKLCTLIEGIIGYLQ